MYHFSYSFFSRNFLINGYNILAIISQYLDFQNNCTTFVLC